MVGACNALQLISDLEAACHVRTGPALFASETAGCWSVTAGGRLDKGVPKCDDARVLKAAHDAQLPQGAPGLVWTAEHAWNPLQRHLHVLMTDNAHAVRKPTSAVNMVIRILCLHSPSMWYSLTHALPSTVHILGASTK